MIPQDEAGALVAPEHSFEVGILDPFFTDPFTEIRKSWRDRSELLLHFLLNIALAPLTVARAVARVRPGGFWSALVPLATFLAMFVLLHVVQIAADGVFVFAWVFFIGTVTLEYLFFIYFLSISEFMSNEHPYIYLRNLPLVNACLLYSIHRFTVSKVFSS